MSKTKRSILRSLLERRKMLSELSADLELSMPTIKEHLHSLEKGELVELFDDGHKWKYWELTDKGKGIVSEAKEKPKITFTLMFMIPLMLIVAGVAVGQLPIYQEWTYTEFQTVSVPHERTFTIEKEVEVIPDAETAGATTVTAPGVEENTVEEPETEIVTEEVVETYYVDEEIAVEKIERVEPVYVNILSKILIISGIALFGILIIKKKRK